MNPVAELAVFAGIMALVQFSPGPDMLLLTRTALRHGVANGLKMAGGIACGLTVHATIAVAGLALLMGEIVILREGIRWAAVVYLLWLAWAVLREYFVIWYSGAGRREEFQEENGGPFLRGLLCNLLNPKAALFLASISAPFLIGERPVWWPAALWGVMVFQGGVLWMLWALLLQWNLLRRAYERASRWIDGMFVLVLVLLAGRLALG